MKITHGPTKPFHKLLVLAAMSFMAMLLPHSAFAFPDPTKVQALLDAVTANCPDGTVDPLPNTFDCATCHVTVGLKPLTPKGQAIKNTSSSLCAAPANNAPTANANGPYSGQAGASVAFSSTGSSDPDGDTLTYAWDFGDGASSTQSNPSHTYAAAGTFNVSLTVDDGNGGSDTANTTANITAPPPPPPSNNAPTANANGPYSGQAGTAVSFSSAGSSDPDGDTLTFAWDFGDGATSTQSNPSHTYAAAGNFTVSLTVDDGNGSSDTANTTATIAAAPPPPPGNNAPTANANGPYSGQVGASVSFSSGGSSDPDGDTLSYSWDFGDGASSSQANPSHSYAAAGNFTVSLTVDDGNGGSDTATTSANITAAPPPPPTANQAPTLTMIGDWNLKVGDVLAVPLSATDPENDSLMFDVSGLPAEFALTDNGDGTGSIDGMATTAGQYDVTVTVTETTTSTPLSDSEMFTITVKDDVVTTPTYRVKEAEAEWDREKKILKVKGKIKPIARGTEDEDMCSAVDGEIVSISNADGKALFDTTINCENKFKARMKVQRDLITCRIEVSADFLESKTIRVGGCKDGRNEDRDEDDEDDEDDHHASVDTDFVPAISTVAAVENRIAWVKKWLRSLEAKRNRLDKRQKRAARLWGDSPA